jgi:hypothetical protein
MTRSGASPLESCSGCLGFRVLRGWGRASRALSSCAIEHVPCRWLYYGRHGHRLLLGVDWLELSELLSCGLERQKIG